MIVLVLAACSMLIGTTWLVSCMGVSVCFTSGSYYAATGRFEDAQWHAGVMFAEQRDDLLFRYQSERDAHRETPEFQREGWQGRLNEGISGWSVSSRYGFIFVNSVRYRSPAIPADDAPGFNRSWHAYPTSVAYGVERAPFGEYVAVWVHPILPLAICVPIPVVAFIRGPMRRWRRRRHSQCLTCGYNLTDNTSGICPECGTKMAPSATGRTRSGSG